MSRSEVADIKTPTPKDREAFTKSPSKIQGFRSVENFKKVSSATFSPKSSINNTSTVNTPPSEENKPKLRFDPSKKYVPSEKFTKQQLQTSNSTKEEKSYKSPPSPTKTSRTSIKDDVVFSRGKSVKSYFPDTVKNYIPNFTGVKIFKIEPEESHISSLDDIIKRNLETEEEWSSKVYIGNIIIKCDPEKLKKINSRIPEFSAYKSIIELYHNKIAYGASYDSHTEEAMKVFVF
jgi:hypothetical protein